MVDFKKRLGAKKTSTLVLDPEEIYDGLDRASDKGPLRPAQKAVLADWHKRLRGERDVIVKMHTGQGKTLIGLLMLQSKLNEGIAPALYLCPNIHLVDQTVTQAKQFGIHCCTAEDGLPAGFTDGDEILVTTVQKLFNGLTKFKLAPQSQQVGALVMDDCHTCIDAIRANCTLRLPRTHRAYGALLALFAPDLTDQGAGTTADVQAGQYDSFLAVPYWAWQDRSIDVATILARDRETKEMKYVWPLLKDILRDCTCIISGATLEITPHLPPLHRFGSYADAKHRVFMSATVTNDAFLVKGLGLSPETIRKPLVYKDEKWSGEKMILIPTLIHASLDRDAMIKILAKPQPKRRFGVVVLTPSFESAKDWEDAGAKVVKADTIFERIEALKQGACEETVVAANRYDGIDLADNACRILVMDSKPFGETLTDRWTEFCRAGSEILITKTVRTIEQGLGRSVRGEKDYSVIILTGPELVNLIRTKKTRPYFSAQTQMQIQIGLDIAEFAKEEIADNGTATGTVLQGLVNQCLKRDAGWKDFYSQQMATLTSTAATPHALDILTVELEAEQAFQEGQPKKAIQLIQGLIDKQIKTAVERGWYLQELARYAYPTDKAKSNELQVAAHRNHRYLLKPRQGMIVEQITAAGQKRIERLMDWIGEHDTPQELLLHVEAILNRLRFGVSADDFEAAVDELGTALGFPTQRPDKEWKEGPDNLWAVRDGCYLVCECKNQVDPNRQEINKGETGQMNNSCAWFKRNYPGAEATNIMIIWTKIVGAAGGFNEPVLIMSAKRLDKLVRNVRGFFQELKDEDLRNLAEARINKNLDSYHLGVDELLSAYGEAPKQL
ncbi:MAG: DEAD/DEAH box helicase family protein [Chloroflexi bacterium]|nr:DEAD/DEAH box helicase family protein [Chloroflexota bacterium]